MLALAVVVTIRSASRVLPEGEKIRALGELDLGCIDASLIDLAKLLRLSLAIRLKPRFQLIDLQLAKYFFASNRERHCPVYDQFSVGKVKVKVEGLTSTSPRFFVLKLLESRTYNGPDGVLNKLLQETAVLIHHDLSELIKRFRSNVWQRQL